MPSLVLSRRALNRATMQRQLLLDRAPMAPLDAVGHLVGLQAQEPRDPYVALWSRLEGFDPAALGCEIEERRAVRIVLMRATIHLATAADCLLNGSHSENLLRNDHPLHFRSPGVDFGGASVAKIAFDIRSTLISCGRQNLQRFVRGAMSGLRCLQFGHGSLQ